MSNNIKVVLIGFTTSNFLVENSTHSSFGSKLFFMSYLDRKMILKLFEQVPIFYGKDWFKINRRSKFAIYMYLRLGETRNYFINLVICRKYFFLFIVFFQQKNKTVVITPSEARFVSIVARGIRAKRVGTGTFQRFTHFSNNTKIF